jgi:tripartite-type tricarboxylate transporter receptor subunit TctC
MPIALSRAGSVLMALVIGVSAVTAAGASDFANQVTRIVVPFAPGGGTDIISRTLAQEMAKEIGGTVIVENKPGAGTVLGTDFVAKAKPDGHTLLMATFAHAVNPSLHKKLPFDTEKDFVPVSLIARSYNVVVVNPKSGINSIADLVALAKAKPDALNYGTFGPGTSAHLAGELFKSLAGVQLMATHYKGSAPAITDLLSGTIHVMFSTVASVTSLVQSGQLKALAVTSAQRSAAYPDLPTVAEAGVPGYAAESWYGVFAPAKTAPEVIALLNVAAGKSVKSPAFDKLVENEGLIMVGGPPERLDQYVRGEQARWQKVIGEAGIKFE